MQPRLILHIGHFKTGTTALQVFLARHRSRLARQGLVYARTTEHLSKHSALAFALLREAGATTLMHGYTDPTPATRLWDALADEARSIAPGAELVVSSEEFIRLGAHPLAIAGLRACLARMPDVDVRAIAYLRPPHSHLESWYNQLVKMNAAPGDFDATVSIMEEVHTDYSTAILPWAEVLGPGRVLLRSYGASLREGNALACDFLGALGYRLPLWPKPSGNDPNPRLDPRTLDMRRAFRRHGLSPTVTDRWVTRLSAQLAPPAQATMPPASQVIRGIEALRTLPGAALDWDAMLADLPRGSDADLRVARQVIDLLCAELVRVRRKRRQSS